MNRSPLADAGAFLIVAIAWFLVGASGCRPAAPLAAQPIAGSGPPPSGFPRTVTDARGKRIVLSAPPRRIVSLAPSNTEVLFALGAGSSVVADTASCDFPPEAKNRPHISGLSAGDLEKIEAQNPDLVVTVGSLNGKLIAALDNAGIPVLVVNPHTLSDVYASIHLLGQTVGKEAAADTAIASMKTTSDHILSVTAKAASRPRVLILYGTNPIYTSPPDSFIHDIIQTAGGNDIVTQALPQNIIASSVVVERAPDVIICSQSLVDRARQLPGWNTIPAVRNNRFYTADSVLTRPVPRLAESIQRLAHYLHPELFAQETHSADSRP